VALEISVNDTRCPAGSPVAILDSAGKMLSCFPAVADAIHARAIMERGLAIDADVPGKIDHLTNPDADDDDDPDPDDMEDPDPDDTDYYRRFIVEGVD
jgi:hypothetical protein